MKEAGVDFITTCMDLNGMKTLAEELTARTWTTSCCTTRTPTTSSSSLMPATCSRATSSRCSSDPSRPTPRALPSRTTCTGWRRPVPSRRSWRWWAGSTPPSRSTGCSPPVPSSTGTRSSRPPTASPTSPPAASSSRSTGPRPTRPSPTTAARTTTTAHECSAAGAGGRRRVRDRGPARRAVAVLPAWHGVGGARAHQLRLIRDAPAPHAAGGVRRRRHLPGDPPRDAAGHGLRARRARVRPHLQDVRRLQPGLRRAGVRVGGHVLPGPGGVGVGASPPPSSSPCSCWRPLLGLLLERLIFSHLRTASVGRQAGRGPRPDGRAPRAVRHPRRLRGGGRSAPRPASCPTAPRVFYDPFGVYALQPRTSWWRWSWRSAGMAGLGSALPLHRRSACACGRWSRARG